MSGILTRMIIIVLFRFSSSSSLIPRVGSHKECYFLLVYSDLDLLFKKSMVTYIHCSVYMVASPLCKFLFVHFGFSTNFGVC